MKQVYTNGIHEYIKKMAPRDELGSVSSRWGGSEEEETMISWDTEPLRGMDYSLIAWHQDFLNEDEEWLSMINKNMS